ncbi:hypothetical protein J1605_002139 [Eschrichtius robustus]|uniref:Neurabin-1/2 PDZ domain-containing protein n=1 Tax=Eschrichtius robustus TaxID=9764 RepID=A0AB34HX59_ESCRO|nr:hypothetical protein J1605_002139 [Eschrichtius robustus]
MLPRAFLTPAASPPLHPRSAASHTARRGRPHVGEAPARAGTPSPGRPECASASGPGPPPARNGVRERSAPPGAARRGPGARGGPRRAWKRPSQPPIALRREERVEGQRAGRRRAEPRPPWGGGRLGGGGGSRGRPTLPTGGGSRSVKMLKTESSGERTTLRSASPHRNAYRTEFQALKSTFDKPKSDGEQKTKEGEGSQQSRGRKYGSNVNRIKNLFMQMGMEPSENAAVIAKTRGKGGPSSPQRRMKPKEFLEKTDGSVVKLESSVSERISRFDTMYDGPSYSKFTETRKMFERSVHESGQNNRYSPKKEKTGGSEPQDEWGGSKSNRGSTDSLDSLSSRTEAVSPTVSQLGAVLENTDSPSAIISEKAENSEYSVTGHYPLNLPSVTVTNLDTFGHLKDSNSWSPPSKHSDDAEDAQKSHTTPVLEVASKSTSLASVPTGEAQQSKEAEDSTSNQETADRTDRDIPEEPCAENKAVTESEIPSPQNEPSEDAEAHLVGSEAAMQQKKELAGGDFTSADASGFSCGKEVFEDSNNFGSSHVYMHSDYNIYRVRSRYNSDWGETGTEQDEQEDSDENSYSQPDMEYSEIVGLPEEEDIPANRKIKFSSAPIKVLPLEHHLFTPEEESSKIKLLHIEQGRNN